MKDILIHNAKVCIDNRLEKRDVLIKDGIIFLIDENIDVDNDTETIDGTGKYLLPGFIDIHTHLDDVIAGCNLADSYSSGTELAIMNGITTLYSFVTQSSEDNLIGKYKTVRKKAEAKSFCNVGWHITPIRKDEETIAEVRKLIHQGCKTIKLYTTYKEAGIYSSYEDIRFWAETLKPHNITIMVHCEDEDELKKSLAKDYDFTKAYSHALMRTKQAEIEAVKIIIEIAKTTKTKFHIVHVSNPETVNLLNEAKDSVSISFETCPQYLLLNDFVLQHDDGYKFLCSPPIRDEATQLAMYEKAINNEIDLFATDHCAFTKEDKYHNYSDIRKVPNGLPGIGALVPLIYEIQKYKGEECFCELARTISENPARLIGKYPQKGCIKVGSDADLVLVSKLEKQRRVKASSSNVYDPYDEFETDLNISYVLLGGEIVIKNNELLDKDNPKGMLL